MNTKVDAAVAGKTSVEQQQRSDHPTAEQEQEKDAQAEGIGGMTGDETIEPAAITVDQIDYIGKVWAMRGTQAMEVGLAETAGKLVAKRHKQSNHKDDEQGALPLIVPDNSIEQTEEKGNPRGCLRDCHHDAVEEKRGRAIQGNE